MQRPKLKCKLGLHQWGKWSEMTAYMKTGVYVSYRQAKRCKNCGKYKIRIIK